jgi:uracil-DNA glycosylase
MPHRGDGPIPARIMLVGEAWGADEEREGIPFVGYSGQELNRMLHEAGIMRSECFVTNVVNRRPPDNDLSHWIAFKKKQRTPQHVLLRDKMVLPVVVDGYNQLLSEIQLCQPNVIVTFGNLSMWALTGNWGILKWRGSQLRAEQGPKLIPTIHPASVLREWSQRSSVINDLRRVQRHIDSREYQKPDWNFILRPSFDKAISTLQMLFQRAETEASPVWIELDLETRSGHIACCGLSWSRVDAISIPFMCVENKEGYWAAEEEAHILHLMYRLLTHRNVRVRWQNGLYDAQYTHRHWHFVPRGAQDTMISQHAIFSDLPKALYYQASIYCDWYVYWKDEGKIWDSKMPEDRLWAYNCQDDVYTREVGEVELETVEKMGLKEVHDFQQKMFWPVLKAMLRGIKIVKENRDKLAEEVQEQIAVREQLLLDMLGHAINPRSPVQMQKLFYDDLGQPVIMTRAKKGAPSRPTCDDEALTKIAAREPLLKPITNCIQDIRTLEKYLDVILMKLDTDGRARCSYNIGGSESGKSAPKTYRLSSSKNAFGSGANLQNISSEKSKSVGKAAQRGHIAMLGDPYQLPNVRSLFGPDLGYIYFNQDLDRADLQVVVWESDDAMLKEALRRGVDIHLLNAFVIDGREPPAMDELIETHPKYLSWRGPMKLKREFSKVFCHGTNYVGGIRTMAQNTGRTMHEIDRAQKIWFGAHPGIKRWHQEIELQINKRRYVENKFGYRWYIFDRLDNILPEAVAWIPQSTVSIVINKIWMNHYEKAPWIDVLLQVHDSLGGQFPAYRKEEAIKLLQENARVVIPYDDPLIIPTSIGTSEASWGDC